MADVPFIKMHGCGNDYVYLDCFENPVPKDPNHVARLVSDRHRGVGSDGLVLMLPGDVPQAVARMRMFNADGSESALCGNALRCMAMWLHQTQRCGTEFRIAMAERLIDVTILESDHERRRANVKVILGQPASLNPAASGRAAFVMSMDLNGLMLPAMKSPPLHVSMGNPHTILFVESLRTEDVGRLGPLIENHPAFPNRTNVEFVQVTGPTTALVRVWERGSGETLACGSGACAVVIAGKCCEVFSATESVDVTMAGGQLQVDWDAHSQVHLAGPAEESFRGIVNI